MSVPALFPILSPVADRPPLALPVRQMSRLSSEMHLGATVAVNGLTPRRYDHGLVVLLLARLCLPDWWSESTLRAPDRLTSFSSINALAASLKRPFENIRRHVKALVDAGLCVIDERGVALSSEPAGAAAILSFYRAAHDLFVRLIDDFAALDTLPQPKATPAQALTPRIIATALDSMLVPFDRFEGTFSDWTAGKLWNAIGVANIRSVMLDPLLSRRFAIESTPDRLREPVSLRAAAAAIAMPYATAWRHCRMLRDHDLVEARGHGWVVTTAQLRDEVMEARVVASIHYYLRRIGELIAAGLDPGGAKDLYLQARPPLVAFGRP